MIITFKKLKGAGDRHNVKVRKYLEKAENSTKFHFPVLVGALVVKIVNYL